MPFNYTLTPQCTSAQPIKENGKIIGYDGVGCPGSVLSKDIINCNNGRFVTDNEVEVVDGITKFKGNASCNDIVNYKIVGSQCQNFHSVEYEEPSYENTFNNLRFRVGQIVYVENIADTLKSFSSKASLEDFYDWNTDFRNILDILQDNCGTGMSNTLYGRIIHISKIPNKDNTTINYTTNDGFSYSIELSKWPKEIFWLKLINGTQFGLSNFGLKNEKSALESSVTWLDNDIISNNSLLFPVVREDITNLRTRLSIQGSNYLNRSQIMNTPRFRSRGSCTTGSLCLDTTLTPSFKNSTKNMYLAPIPYAQRLGNTFRSSLARGTKKIIRKNCVNPQFGRLVGTGGPRLVNKF